MNCPSGFWLEVEIEWLRLVCVDRRHCGRQEQRCGEGLVELTQNAGVGDAHDRRARGHRVGRAPGAGVRWVRYAPARRSEEGRGPVAHTHTHTHTHWGRQGAIQGTCGELVYTSAVRKGLTSIGNERGSSSKLRASTISPNWISYACWACWKKSDAIPRYVGHNTACDRYIHTNTQKWNHVHN